MSRASSTPDVTDAQYDEIVAVLIAAAERGVEPAPEPEPAA